MSTVGGDGTQSMREPSSDREPVSFKDQTGEKEVRFYHAGGGQRISRALNPIEAFVFSEIIKEEGHWEVQSLPHKDRVFLIISSTNSPASKVADSVLQTGATTSEHPVKKETPKELSLEWFKNGLEDSEYYHSDLSAIEAMSLIDTEEPGAFIAYNDNGETRIVFKDGSSVSTCTVDDDKRLKDFLAKSYPKKGITAARLQLKMQVESILNEWEKGRASDNYCPINDKARVDSLISKTGGWIMHPHLEGKRTTEGKLAFQISFMTESGVERYDALDSAIVERMISKKLDVTSRPIAKLRYAYVPINTFSLGRKEEEDLLLRALREKFSLERLPIPTDHPLAISILKLGNEINFSNAEFSIKFYKNGQFKIEKADLAEGSSELTQSRVLHGMEELIKACDDGLLTKKTIGKLNMGAFKLLQNYVDALYEQTEGDSRVAVEFREKVHSLFSIDQEEGDEFVFGKGSPPASPQGVASQEPSEVALRTDVESPDAKPLSSPSSTSFRGGIRGTDSPGSSEASPSTQSS